MAVNLSPVGGVAGQFFDDNGNPLAGGKIFTYAAGTTTNQATYTSASGAIAHSNPIILDGAGRVPSGEIWLTDGLEYKFVIKDSVDALIGTYDNIIGINSNFVNFTNQQELQTATAGQTVFTLTTMQYQPGTNSLSVFVDGVNQYGPGALYAYVETDSTTVTFTTGLHVGAEVKFTTSQLNSTAGGTAAGVSFTGFKGQTGNVQNLADDDGSDWIGFEQAGIGAIAISAQDKMRQIISVKDFGAVGDGVTNDTPALQAALTAAGGNALYIPAGIYLVDALTVPADTCVYGDGIASTLKKRSNGDMLTLDERVTLELFCLDGQGATYTGRGCVVSTGALDNVSWRKFINLDILNMASHCIELTVSRAGYSSQIINCRMTLAGANQWIIGCVKLPTAETNGNRFMLGCWTFANRMFDAGECDNFIVNGCQGAAPILNPLSKKVSMVNCRVVNVGDSSLSGWTVTGTQSTYASLIVGLNVTFASTCANIKWNNSVVVGTITDNSTGASSGNEIYYLPQTSYVPTWTGGSPSIGNGTLTSSYTRKGVFVQVNVTFIVGSTTNVGSGAWTFGLPFAANRPTVGSAYLVNAAGNTIFSGVAFVDAGAQTFRVVTSNSSSAFVGSAQPFAWATGDKMYVSIEYPIFG